MKHIRYATERNNKHGVQYRTPVKITAFLCSLFLFAALAASFSFSPGETSAAGDVAPLFQSASSTPDRAALLATAAASNSDVAVPRAAGTVIAPAAVSTGAVPQAQTTGAPSNSGNGQSGAPGTVSPQSSSGGFPWWILIPFVALLLAGVAFASMRGRQSNVATVTTTTVPPSARVPYGAPTVASTESRTGVVAPLGTGAATVAMPVPAVVEIKCPNCGTMNGLDENFCHECGQDLRQARSQMMASTDTLGEPVDEYTPYLETLGRVDEQLEYVLSRPVVLLGSASSNDISIDPSFAGSTTVAQVHAELRREGSGFVILDKGSNTGTFVNEARVVEQPLADNDHIRIGEVGFVYHAPARG